MSSAKKVLGVVFPVQAIGTALFGAPAYVAIEARRQAKKMKNAMAQRGAGEASKQMFKDAASPKQIILGHPVLSGPMVFASEEGAPNDEGVGEWANVVVHLAGHVCDDVTHAWLDDELLVRQASTTSGADIEFRHKNGAGWVYIYLGDHNKVPPTLASLPDWDSSMRGDQQCFAHIKLRSDPDKWPSSIPNAKFAVKGMRLFDPRTGQTQWSDNPALMVRWYRTALKLGVPIDESYISSANICDELVSTPSGTEKRYRCNYAFFADTNPRQVLQTIRSTCAGESLRVAGRHAIQVGAFYGPGVVTLNENDVVGDITVNPDVRRRDLINTVSAKYADPEDNWNTVDMPVFTHTGFVAQDGYEVVDDLDLMSVPSPYQAQRLAKIHLLTIRDALTINFSCTLKAMQLLPGTVFRFDFPENEWQGVEFIVTNWKHSKDGVVALEARQTKLSHYEFNGSTAKVPERPGLPSLVSRDVEAVTHLTYTTLFDSNTLQALITWQHRSLGGTSFELSFYKDGEFLRKENVIDKQYRLQDGFSVGQYEVRVVAISYERRSPVASLAFNAAAPQTPIGCEVNAGNWVLELMPVSAGAVNFDTMYDFALGFEEAATDTELEQFIVGRAKVITVSNLKADTLYHIAVREVSRWGVSNWYRTSAQTTFNSDDVWEVIHGDIDRVLNDSLESTINQIEQRTNNLNEKQDVGLNALLNEIGDYHREDETQRQKISLAYARRVLSQQADEISAQATELLELLAKYDENTAYIQELSNAVANNEQALAESQQLLLAKIEDGDEETLSRANTYTRAAVGYCVDAEGNVTSHTDAVACVAAGHSWLDGPLAEFIRNLQITTGAGTASVSQMGQVFVDNNGELAARGSLTTNVNGKISGFVNHQSGDVSAIDLIADITRIGTMSNGNFVPLLRLDTWTRELVLRGRMILGDGYEVKSQESIQSLSPPGWYVFTLRNGLFPSDNLASSDFKSRVGRLPRLDEHLTYRNATGSVTSTKRWNGSGWGAPALLVNGDMIAIGSVSGDRFIAGTEIISPLITGGSIHGGYVSGSNVVANSTGILTPSEFNQEVFGTMDVHRIYAEGHAPYLARTVFPRSTLRPSFFLGTPSIASIPAASSASASDVVWFSGAGNIDLFLAQNIFNTASQVVKYDHADKLQTLRYCRKEYPAVVILKFQITCDYRNVDWSLLIANLRVHVLLNNLTMATTMVGIENERVRITSGPAIGSPDDDSFFTSFYWEHRASCRRAGNDAVIDVAIKGPIKTIGNVGSRDVRIEVGLSNSRQSPASYELRLRNLTLELSDVMQNIDLE
ncbi:hypothetical protein M3926_000421 [Vibrio metschnikovii]|nr:hypothetical protein [Vibrio metschnikovii]